MTWIKKLNIIALHLKTKIKLLGFPVVISLRVITRNET